MAKMICVALNGGEEPTLGVKDQSTYNDVRNSADAWAESYIEYCTSLEIVSGVGGGRFNPSATVTGSQAAKMLLVALGYDPDVFGFTGSNWQINVDANANAANLYDNLGLDVADRGLTRDEAAQMIYNALNANVMVKEYDKVLSNGEISYNYALSDYKTMLSEKFGVYRVEGVVVANEYASLAAPTGDSTGLLEGKTHIYVTNPDEMSYSVSNGTRVILSVATAGNGVTPLIDNNTGAINATSANQFSVTTGADELGKAVVLYVKPATNSQSTDKATVIGDVILGDNNILTATGKWGSQTKMDSALKGAGLKAALPDVYYVNAVHQGADNGIVNGDMINGYATQFIDFDVDGTVDLVLVDKVDFGMVSAYSTKNDGSITLSTGGSAISYKDSDDVVGFDDVKKGDYVLYSEVGGKLYVEKAPSVVGTLTDYSKQTGDDPAQSALWIDGTKYTNSGVEGRTVNDLSDPKGYTNLDKEATFYFDACGYIAAVDGTAVKQYALITYRNENAATDNSIKDNDRVQATYEDGTSSAPVLSHTVKDYDAGSNETWGTVSAASPNANAAQTELNKLSQGVSTPSTIIANSAQLAILGSYEFNSDDELVFVPTNTTYDRISGDLEYTSGNVLIKQGGATLNDGSGYNLYLTDETVLFIATTEDVNALYTNSEVDKVTVYNGKDSFPSLDLEENHYELQYITNADNEIVAMAIITDDLNTIGDNYLYVIKVVSSSANTKQVMVVLDGEVQTITVNSKKTAQVALGVNEYTIQADGNYKLDDHTSNVVSGEIIERKNENRRTIVVNGTEYKVLDDTDFANVADEEATSFEELNRGDIVTILANENGGVWEVLGVYVTKAVKSEAPTKLSGATTPDENYADGAYENEAHADTYYINFNNTTGGAVTYTLNVYDEAGVQRHTDTSSSVADSDAATFTVEKGDVTYAGTYWYTVENASGTVVLSGTIVF